jgi:uracil-DNA glycosylase family 4
MLADPWLEAELEAVHPELIVCLGATAAQSLLGLGFKVTQSHGEVQQANGFPPIIATLHPSAILHAGQTKTENGISRSSWMTCGASQLFREITAYFQQELGYLHCD